MTNSEARITRLEAELKALDQELAAVKQQLGQVAQNQYAATGGGTGSGGDSGPMQCTLSGAIAASGGSPGGPLTNQTVSKISGGAFSIVNTAASVYNPLPNAIASGKVCLVEQNADGTFSIIAVAC